MLTYHLLPAEDYDPAAPAYTPASYNADGFVHTSNTLAALAGAGNRYYRADPRPYLVLTVDLDRLQAPWRHDAVGDSFPHIYGPINRAAIFAAHHAVRGADGTYLAQLGAALAE